MRRSTVCFALCLATLVAAGTPSSAQLLEEPLRLGAEAPSGAPALGRMSIIDDDAQVTSSVSFGRGTTRPFSAYVGTYQPGVDGDSRRQIQIDDKSYDVGVFAGVAARLGASGLRWDVGLKYQPGRVGPQITLATPEADESLGVYGALRYDFGLAAVTASLNYARPTAASRKGGYTPMLAAEVPIGRSFTVSAGVSPHWASAPSEPGAADNPEWGVAGRASLLGFDVSLSYAEFGAVNADTRPETRALLRIQGAF